MTLASKSIFLLPSVRLTRWPSRPVSSPQAVLLAQDIRDRERGGRAQIGVVEGADEQSSPELMKVMTAVLGQRTGPVKEAVPDDGPSQAQNTSVKLYQ